MNYTAKKLREAAEYIGDGETCSDTAIVTVREMFDVGRADTFGGDLGRVLVAIADELDELDDKATRRRSHIVKLESTISERNRELRGLRGKVPAERERQILDMWPRYEDGAYVWLGDRFGDNKGEPREIEGITLYSHGIDLYDDEGFHKPLDHGERLKLPVQSVLDADGVEIHVGDTVWHCNGIASGVVTSIDAGSLMNTTRYVDESGTEFRDAARNLTHIAPDSWERLVEDAAKHPCVYAEGAKGGKFSKCSECPWGNECDGSRAGEMMARDVIRRAKALAGIEVD